MKIMKFRHLSKESSEKQKINFLSFLFIRVLPLMSIQITNVFKCGREENYSMENCINVFIECEMKIN